MKTSARQAPPLRAFARRAVITVIAAAGITAAACATVATIAHHSTLDMSNVTSSDDSMVVTAHPDDLTADVTRLVVDHGCWTGESNMPADMDGQIPGHVVVTTAASPARAIYSADLVVSALDQVLSPSADADLTVYAFCR